MEFMAGIIGLKIRMYLTLALVFAIGFGIIYAIMVFFGAGFYAILVFALLFFLLQWYISPVIMKHAARLHYLEKNEDKELQDTVAELADEAGVPRPRVAIADVQEPNAFVFGRTRNSATLVVHKGLLNMLDKKELRAVLAHEIGHLKHSDVSVMVFVSFIPMLAYIIAQSMFFSSIFGGMGGRRNSSAYAIAVGAGAFIIYLVTQLLILSLSRSRESYADEYSATSTKKPEDLATSLLKITTQNTAPSSPSQNSTVARSFYIVDSFTAGKETQELTAHVKELKELLPNFNINSLIAQVKGETRRSYGLFSLFTTHPPTYKRILALAGLKHQLNAQGVSK